MSKLWSRRSALALAAGVVPSVVVHRADAQERGVIRLLVGFPPGGASDSIARILGEKLQTALKQTVIVENRPGVGGRIAAQAVKAAAPDGLTMMVAPNATLTFQHLTYPTTTLGYDMTTDFTPVARLTSYPMAMVVSADIGVKSAKDYVAWLKANPDKNTFGTAGAGGDTHFNGLQFATKAGVAMSLVPYRGNAPLVTDLLGGHIKTGIMVLGDASAHIQAGKLVPLGIFAPRRSDLAPEVPRMAEQGFDTGGNDGWIGLYAPAKLPVGELERLQSAVKGALAEPEVAKSLREKFVQFSDYRPTADVERQLKMELDHWGPIITASGFKPQP